MRINHYEGNLPNMIEQCNYPTLRWTSFYGWHDISRAPDPCAETVAIWRITYKTPKP